MADWFKAFVAGQQKLVGSFVVVFLTLALSFAGAFETPITPAQPAQAAGQVCANGWTLVTAAGTYKNYCYKQMTNTASTLTVPPGVNTLVVNAYGGGGGNGGNAYDGCCGHDGWGGGGGAGDKVIGNLTVTAGQVIGFYPGTNGATGGQNSNLTSAGGVSSYSTAYNGGTGAPGAGNYFGGSGGGGGAATILTVDSTIKLVAAGGGGGGGAAYCQASGTGATGPVANGTATNGGNGSGKGGGGGGGVVGGAGGASQGYYGSCSNVFGTQYRGLGGARATSTTTFGTLSTHSASINGQIDAWYAPTPVATITLNAETQPPTLNSWTYTVNFLPDTTGVESSDFTMLENGQPATGWNIGAVTGGPATFSITVTKSGLADQTPIALQVDQSLVQNQSFGQAGVGTSQSADFIVDTLAPTVTSIDVTPDLVTANKISVTMNFSEPIYQIDLTKILLAGTSTTWTPTKPAVTVYPISSYTFTVVSSALVDGTLLITGSAQVVTDAAGNKNTVDGALSEAVNTTTKPSVTMFAPRATRFKEATQTFDVVFNRAIYGLTTADFSFVTNAGCALDAVGGSGFAYTLSIKTCTTGGDVKLRLALNSVKDKVAISGPVAAVDSEIATRDIVGPTVTSISDVVKGNSVDYTYTFSEPVFGFTAADLSSYTGTTTAGWTFTEPVRVGTTNSYTFTASNPNAVTGVLKVNIATGSIADDVGNVSLVLTAQNYTDSNADLWFLPTFTTGTLATISSQDTALAPSFTLDGKGGNINGIRVTITNAKPGDTLSATALSGMSVTVTNGSVLTATGTTPTLANWQTFIQSIKIKTTSTDTTARSIEFHLKPFVGYSFETGQVYEQYSSGLGWDALKAIANAKNLGSNYGYLAVINDVAERDFVTGFTTQTVLTGMKKTVGTDTTNFANEIVKAFDGPDLTSTLTTVNWYTAQPDAASQFCLAMYSTGQVGNLGKFSDVSCTSPGTLNALIEYGGMPGGTSFVSSQTVNASVDVGVPSVSSVTGAPTTATSALGSTANPLVLTVNFSKAFRNLATTDFTFTGAGIAGCVVSAVGSATDTTAPYQSTVTVTGCTAAGAVSLKLNDFSINDMTGTTGNLGPAANDPNSVLASFTRDIVAPSITLISKAITDTTVTYSYTFSEPVVGFTASSITLSHSVAGGATGWDISAPVRVPSTNAYVFTVSNPNAFAGNVSLSISTTAVRDESGNALTSGVLITSSVDQSIAKLAFLQSFTVGTLNAFSLASPNVLAPQITLDGRGQTIAGFRITNKDFVTGDVFTLPAGSYGDITVVSNTNGVITLSGTTATITQWQTALRAIRLQLGNTGGSSRAFEFHMQPTKNYWLDNGHFYEFVDNGAAMTQATADPLAAARTLYGASGYLAVPFTQAETTFLQGLSSITANAWVGLQKTAALSLIHI